MRISPFRRSNRAKKHRLVRLAAGFEKFLLSVWDKKLVLVTSTLLFLTGYYIRNLAVGIPEELFENAQEHDLRAAQISYDVNKMGETANKIQVAVDSFQDTFKNAGQLGSGI